MFPFIFTENALEDILKHAINYETKQEGLGTRFMNEIDAAAVEISKIPKAFISNYKTTRELKTKIFPYKLIYTFEASIIYIHAVYPCKADPKHKYNNIK